MNEKFLAYLQDTSGLEKEALAAFVNADGTPIEEKLDDLLKTARDGVAKKLKVARDEEQAKGKDAFQNGYSKAKKEERTALEEELCTELGLEKVRGDEFKTALKQKLAAPANTTIDKNAIEKSEFHLSAIAKLKEEHANTIKAKEEEFNTFKAQVEGEKTFERVWNTALPLIEEAKPAFNEGSETVRNFQWQSIKDGLTEGGRKFDIQENGARIVVLDKDGNLAKDAMGNPFDFKKLVLDTVTNRVGVLKSEPRESTGIKPGQGQGAKPADGKVKVPTTEAEAMELMGNKSISIADRQAAINEYEKSKSAA